MQSKDPGIAAATIENNVITITPKRRGETGITVTVSDGKASSTETFTVKVEKGLPVFWVEVDPLHIVLDPRQDAFRAEGRCTITRTIGEVGNGDGEDPTSYSFDFHANIPGIVQATPSGRRIEIEALARGETGVVLEVRDGEETSTKSYHVVVAKSIDLAAFAEQGDLSMLEALLSVCAHPNVQDDGGRTPLHRAAEKDISRL